MPGMELVDLSPVIAVKLAHRGSEAILRTLGSACLALNMSDRFTAGRLDGSTLLLKVIPPM